VVVLISAFRKIVAKDHDLQRVQENAALAFKQVLEKELLDGIMVTATVAATATNISHTLGRLPLGFIVVDRQAVASGTEGNIVRTAWTDRIITLKTTGTGAVPLTLWIF